MIFKHFTTIGMASFKVFAVSDMTRPMQVLNASSTEGVVTCFAVLGNGTQIVVGFSNGGIMHFTGSFLKDGGAQIRAIQPVFLLQAHKYPVSELFFCELATSKPNERRVRLFAVMNSSSTAFRAISTATGSVASSTAIDLSAAAISNTDDEIANAGIIVFDMSMSVVYAPSSMAGSVVTPLPAGGAPSVASSTPQGMSATSLIPSALRQPPKALDDRGAPPLCSALHRSAAELLVARTEAIYNFSVEVLRQYVLFFSLSSSYML